MVLLRLDGSYTAVETPLTCGGWMRNVFDNTIGRGTETEATRESIIIRTEYSQNVGTVFGYYQPTRVVETEVPFHTGVEDVDAMLADIQQKLDTLHSLNESLPDPQLSAAMTRMEKAGRSIVEAVEANPAKAKQVRRFANYYLPDAVNVLQQYAKLAKQGVRGENAAAIRAEVEHNAASIATAFENQLDALYAAESMDLSADLTVLQNMLKGQGLSK